MRAVLLIAVFTVGCDQGATVPPAAAGHALEVEAPALGAPQIAPLTIRDDADFVRQATAVLQELFALFADHPTACEQVATRIETWGAQNVTRIARMTDYGKTHPTAPTALTKAFAAQPPDFVNKLSPTMTACFGNQDVVDALQKLEVNAEQLAQRAH
jgi:hypothetical protein